MPPKAKNRKDTECKIRKVSKEEDKTEDNTIKPRARLPRKVKMTIDDGKKSDKKEIPQKMKPKPKSGKAAVPKISIANSEVDEVPEQVNVVLDSKMNAILDKIVDLQDLVGMRFDKIEQTNKEIRKDMYGMTQKQQFITSELGKARTAWTLLGTSAVLGNLKQLHQASPSKLYPMQLLPFVAEQRKAGRHYLYNGTAQRYLIDLCCENSHKLVFIPDIHVFDEV